MLSEHEILTNLKDSIVNFDIEGIKKAAEKAFQIGIPAYKAIIDGMAKGMEIVGQKYEKGEYFLAELIMASETMKEGMNVLEPHMRAGDIKSTGKVIIGTVKGDLHDIGKNVVATLLKAANFEVIDLGVDVSAEKFIEAIKQNQPDIVAMSALLTITMIEMENTVKALQKARLRQKVKIIIGGAPITPDFAKKIGADAAAKDAVEGVRICNQLMKEKRILI
ncbi:corrinoid protein [Candidatus Bathyarchaeota archaeon]|nr:corrinoid protein [Candidatus Bathyarchaeota archaeon]